MSPNNESAAWAFSLLPFSIVQLPQIVAWRLRALQDIWNISAQQAEQYHDATFVHISASMQQGTLVGAWAVREESVSHADKVEVYPETTSCVTKEKSAGYGGQYSEAIGYPSGCDNPCPETQRPCREAVGCVALLLHDEMPAPDNVTGRCAYVTNLFVMPPWRGNGAGYALMQWATQEAQHKGCGKIFLEANPPAQGIFSALGYEEMDGYLRLHFER